MTLIEDFLVSINILKGDLDNWPVVWVELVASTQIIKQMKV